MSTAPEARPPRYGVQRRAKHVANTIELLQRSAAWIVGPVVVGLLAVFMAVQSDYANRANKFFFLFPLVFMPAGFAANPGRRCTCQVPYAGNRTDCATGLMLILTMRRRVRRNRSGVRND